MRKYPDPNTTALGGVATGNIKAQDAATAAPTINAKGCTFIVSAMGARTGSNIAVVAKFEVISVKKLTAAINTNINTIMDSPDKDVIWLPIHTARPLTSKPLAKAIPPPNSKIIPQGICTASSQLINCSFLFLAGIRNSTMAKQIAIMVSSNPGKNCCKRKDLVIQQKAVNAKIKPTDFSS